MSKPDKSFTITEYVVSPIIGQFISFQITGFIFGRLIMFQIASLQIILIKAGT